MAADDSPTTTHLEPGDVYEGYRVVRLIGCGGFGQVYLVKDARNRLWALKLFVPLSARDAASFAKNKTAAQRLLLEAAILQKIQHTHIVHCERHGQAEDGTLWILLEYLPGNTVRRELETSEHGRMPMERVLRLGVQLATALVVVHGHGVVHRDVKPDNLIVMPGDILKLLDFGVSKAQGAGFQTTGGVHYGTSLYMAPDRMMSRGFKPDPRWDIYSAGLTLWEMRAGLHPFLAKAGDVLTHAEVIHKHMGAGNVPSLAERTGDDDDVCAPILRACAHNPRERFQTAEELLEALEDALRRERKLETDRVNVLGTNVTERTRARITSAITEPTLGLPPAAAELPAASEPTPAREPAAVAAPRWLRTEPLIVPPAAAPRRDPPGRAERPRFTPVAQTERIVAPGPTMADPPASAALARDDREAPPPPPGVPSREGAAPAKAAPVKAPPVIAPAPAPKVLRELGRPDLTEAEKQAVANLEPIEARYRVLFLRYLDSLPPDAAIDMDVIGTAIADYLEPAEAPAPEERAAANEAGPPPRPRIDRHLASRARAVPAEALRRYRALPLWTFVLLWLTVGSVVAVLVAPPLARWIRATTPPATTTSGPISVPIGSEAPWTAPPLDPPPPADPPPAGASAASGPSAEPASEPGVPQPPAPPAKSSPAPASTPKPAAAPAITTAALKPNGPIVDPGSPAAAGGPTSKPASKLPTNAKPRPDWKPPRTPAHDDDIMD